jgi:hypothetical protein
MESPKTRRVEYLVLVLIVGGCLGWIIFFHSVATTAELAQVIRMKKPPQQRTIMQPQVLPLLPASGKQPPEFTKVKQVKASPKARRQPTTRELLFKVSKHPGGKERVAAARSGRRGKRPLPPSGKKPSEFSRIKHVRAPVRARRQPTTRELLNKVRSLPGGEQKIQRLRQVRPNISTGSGKTNSPLAWLTNLNPFKAKEVYAQTDTWVLTPAKPRSGTMSFWGNMQIYGASIDLATAIDPDLGVRMEEHHIRALYNSRISNPFVMLHVKIPSTGFYLINFVTRNPVKAYIMHSVGDKVTTEESWDTRGNDSNGMFDHPAVLHLSAGQHYLYFVIDEGDTIFHSVTMRHI